MGRVAKTLKGPMELCQSPQSLAWEVMSSSPSVPAVFFKLTEVFTFPVMNNF
jgi:hypothetical protein